MSSKYAISDTTTGYASNEDPSNSDKRLLMAGSKNVLIDALGGRVITRGGYTRLGIASANLTTSRNAWTWDSSTGVERAQRVNDGLLEVWLGTVDGVAINAWTTVASGFSLTKKLRQATWYDTTEKIDVEVMVNGDANMYEWSGAVAVIDSVSPTTITKKGTLTFGQARFYQGRNLVVQCVRTGTQYPYSGGVGTLTLTGITDTTGLVPGDILVQAVVTQVNKPTSARANDVVFSFENQIAVGSFSDNLVYVSKNSDYTSVAQSTPRVSGEGATLTLDAPTRAINSVGKLLTIFAGNDFIYRIEYAQLTVGTTIAETIKVKRIDTGINQGAKSQETVVPIGDSLAYISNEPALRIISNPDELAGIDPKTFSYPIKPDFEAEDWTDAFGIWVSNVLIFTAPVGGRMWMLNFIQDSDGNLKRYWNPPQTFPVGPLSIFDGGAGRKLYGHSYSVAETYLLFDGRSDGQFVGMDASAKLPIQCTVVYPSDRKLLVSHGVRTVEINDRAHYKSFDEWFVEGEITENAKIALGIDYDEGQTGHIDEVIHGDDEDILEGTVASNSLAQSPLATNPLGGLLVAPSDARRFHVIFDEPREDYFGVGDTYSSNDVDLYWAITARGSNATLSTRRPVGVHK